MKSDSEISKKADECGKEMTELLRKLSNEMTAEGYTVQDLLFVLNNVLANRLASTIVSAVQALGSTTEQMTDITYEALNSYIIQITKETKDINESEARVTELKKIDSILDY